MALLNSDDLFHDWRAVDGLHPRKGGSLQSYARGSDGAYRDRSGVLQTRSSGEPRWDWRLVNGLWRRTTLLEGASTNELTRSEDFSHSDWSTLGTPSVTTDDADAPDGSTTADKVEDDDSNDIEEVRQAITVSDDSIDRVGSVFVKKNTGGAVVRVALKYRNGTTTLDYDLHVDPEDAETDPKNALASGTKGEDYDVIDYNSDWWRVWIVGANNGTGNTSLELRCAPAAQSSGSASSATANSATGSNHFWGSQVEQESFPTSYIATTTATASRSADDLSDSIDFSLADIDAAGGLTVLSEWVELGTAFRGSVSLRYFHIGGPTGTDDPRFTLFSDPQDGKVAGDFDDGTTKARTEVPQNTISLRDHVRARTVINQDGSGDWQINLFISVNGGSETEAGAATIASSLPDAWSENTLTIGAAAGGILYGYAGHIKHVFAKGEQSLATMRSV